MKLGSSDELIRSGISRAASSRVPPPDERTWMSVKLTSSMIPPGMPTTPLAKSPRAPETLMLENRTRRTCDMAAPRGARLRADKRTKIG
ncbi:hypothetical protein D3C85_1721980 [compost metagenome]